MAEAAREREFNFRDQDFQFLSKLVHKRTGIVLRDHKKDMVYSRLGRRLRALQLNSFNQYCQLLESPRGEEEMGQLVNAITTNLTSFFRESHHFDHLRATTLPEAIVQNGRQKRIRLWSAGCSSGAEPYSMAMILAESLEKHHGWDARILATDIDTKMLDRCISGRYRMQDKEDIPGRYQKFVQTDRRDGQEGIVMHQRLRQLATFKPLNLLESWPMKGPFDAIFCRNVVIYFDKDTQATLFARMAKLLKPHGWLYIGHSENLFKVSDQFRLIGKTIYQKVS